MHSGLFFILIFTFTTATAFSQLIASPSFEWTRLSRCPADTCLQIYLKAHRDPKLHCTRDEFKKINKTIISDLDLDKTISGHIKVHLLFRLGGDVYVTRVGAKGLSLNQKQIDVIDQGFSQMQGFDYGSYFNEIQNCIGVLQIAIESGGMADCQNFNFGFRSYHPSNRFNRSGPN